VEPFQERAQELTEWHPCIMYLLQPPPRCASPACALTLGTFLFVEMSCLPSAPHHDVHAGAACVQRGGTAACESCQGERRRSRRLHAHLLAPLPAAAAKTSTDPDAKQSANRQSIEGGAGGRSWLQSPKGQRVVWEPPLLPPTLQHYQYDPHTLERPQSYVHAQRKQLKVATWRQNG